MTNCSDSTRQATSDASVLGIYSSEPEYNARETGVGAARYFLFKALSRKFDRFRFYQPPLAHPDLGAATLGTEHRTLKRSPRVFEAKSRATELHLQALTEKPDIMFQCEFFFAPYWNEDPVAPYVLYNDFTTRLTQREMNSWANPDVYGPFHELQLPLLQRAAHVFCFSDKMRASVVEDYHVDPDRTTTVYTGVNFESFPDRPESKLYSPRRILFVGNDYELKGLRTLLKAFDRLRTKFPDASLDVVGNPAGFSPAGRSFEGVTIHGAVSDESFLQGLFRQATVFALPSRMEAFGHVYAEAMSFGVPCIGNNQGAVPEIIDDGKTGLIAEIDDVDRWTTALDHMLSSETVRSKMGAAAYDKARGVFDWNVVSQRISDVMRALH